MNKLKIQNDHGISSFRNGLNHPLSSAGLYFESKIIEGSHEVRK